MMANTTTHNVTLDFEKRIERIPDKVVARVGDVGSTIIKATLRNQYSDYTVPDGYSVRFEMLKADDTWVRQECSVSGSTASVTLNAQCVSAPGEAKRAYFALYRGTTFVNSTQDFRLLVLPNAIEDGLESTSFADGIEVIVSRAMQIIRDAGLDYIEAADVDEMWGD